MEGKPITGPDWHRGVVFQSPTLYPWMNVRENVEFGPRMRGLPEDEIKEIKDHFLEQVKLSGFGEKNTFEMCIRDRINMDYILSAKSLGALDALTKVNMQILIRDIWKENNSTIFLITHDIDEALKLATRIVVMSKRPGKIIKEFNVAFTHELFENPKYTIHSDEYFEIKEELSLIHI